MKEFELIYEEFHISIYKFLMRLTGDQQLICEKQETLAELGAALMNMKNAYRDVIILRICLFALLAIASPHTYN